jgi:hypothetical protein
MSLPQEFIEEYHSIGLGMTANGVAVCDLTRDELIALLGSMHEAGFNHPEQTVRRKFYDD